MMCLLQSEMEMPGVVIVLDEDNCTQKHLYPMWNICYVMTLSNAHVELPADTMAEKIYTTILWQKRSTRRKLPSLLE